MRIVTTKGIPAVNSSNQGGLLGCRPTICHQQNDLLSLFRKCDRRKLDRSSQGETIRQAMRQVLKMQP